MIRIEKYIDWVNSIGVLADDITGVKFSKNLVVYLAIFMSFGGLIWGSLLVYFDLTLPALIPYGYVVISFLNLINFSFRKNLNTTSIIQIVISMLLPFLLQWELGGFVASGCVMLWSILSLVGSVIILGGRSVYPNLFLYGFFVVFSYYNDSSFASQKPAILTSEISLFLLALNILLIMAIVFVLAKIKVDRDTLTQKELQELYTENEANLKKEFLVHEKLQTSENRYRNLVEESRVLICTHDLWGNLITVNKPGAEILGYTVEELSGKNLAIFLPAEFQSGYHAYLEQITKYKLFESFMTVLTKHGDKRIFLFRNTLVSEPGQEPYVMGSAQDVTEWRKSEHREGNLRRELQTIVSSIDDIVIEFDEKKRFKNFWCRDENKLSRPVSYYVGKTLSEAFSFAPEFASKAQRVYESVLQSGESYSTEVDKDLLPIPISYLIRLNPIIEKDGSIKRCTALLTDITARKLTEKKLAEAFQTQNVLLENLDGGLIVEDETRHVRLANKEFCKLFSIPVSPDQLIGIDCSLAAEQTKHLFSDPENFTSRVGEILQVKNKVLNEELPMADGRVLERDYIPIMINTKYHGHLWHYRDITSRKQSELALRKAKEEAEESNRLKTIFLGNLSHEVRTPLQGILGFAEILENPKLSETKRKEYLGIIKRRTGDMQNIIESLLDMASLETGEIKSFPVRVNLFDSIESTFEKAKQDFDLAGKTIQILLDNQLQVNDTTFVDPQHLHQVLMNLFSNALKFTNEGIVTLRCEQLPAHFKISMIDTGIGIPAEKVERIFEPFRQAHEGISRSKGGIGLGLAICKKMVHMWGGTLEVKSQANKGSIFIFTMPLEINSAVLS
jgi:PAS domain S-box-containing protein